MKAWQQLTGLLPCSQRQRSVQPCIKHGHMAIRYSIRWRNLHETELHRTRHCTTSTSERSGTLRSLVVSGLNQLLHQTSCPLSTTRYHFHLLHLHVLSFNHPPQPPLTPPWTSFTAFTSAAHHPPANVPASSPPLNPCHHHHLLAHRLLSPPRTLQSMTPPTSPAHSTSALSDLTHLPRHPRPAVGRSIIALPRSCETSLIIRVSLL
jgi:hypothetical protein